MTLSLTPAERVLRSRLAAHALHAKYSGREVTRAARAASPGSDDYWLAQVDTDLPEGERLRRARHLKKAYFTRLALKSSIARRRRRGGAE